MWWGFGIASIISLANGLNIFFPSIPTFPNKHIPLDALFTERRGQPFSAVGNAIIIYPFAVGLGFLMPLDLLSSCLLFFFLYKVQYFIAILTDWKTSLAFPIRTSRIPGHTSVSAQSPFGAHDGRFGGHSAQRLDETKQRTQKNRCAIEPHFWDYFGGIFIIGFAMRGGMAMWIAVLFFAAHFATMRFHLHAFEHKSVSRFTQQPLSVRTIALSVYSARGASAHEI